MAKPIKVEHASMMNGDELLIELSNGRTIELDAEQIPTAGRPALRTLYRLQRPNASETAMPVYVSSTGGLSIAVDYASAITISLGITRKPGPRIP